MAWCTLDEAEVEPADLTVSPVWGQVHHSDKFGWHTITGFLLEEDAGDFTPKPLAHGGVRPGLPGIRLDDRNTP